MDYVTLIAETSRKDIDFTKIFPVKKNSVPDPLKYSKIKDWSDVRTGTISKTRKVTYIDTIFEGCKKNKSPGPTSYTP